jgi:multidrug efflux system outer membrane protein
MKRRYPYPVWVVAALASTSLTACATPQGAMPEPLARQATFTQATPAQVAVQPEVAWWRALNDPLLNELVERALTTNRDLLAAEADVRRARALANVQRWSLLPVGGVAAAYSRDRVTQPAVVETDTFAVGADVAWEVDVFGRLRAGARAADAEALAFDEARRGVQVAIAASTAQAYVNLRGAQARRAAARENAEAQRQTLTRTDAVREAGRGSRLDVARAREQLESTEAALAALDADVAAARDALHVLTGGMSPELETRVLADAAIPQAPATLAVGSPEDLLRRRPDIRQAEAQLQAATARVRAAQVDWWPRLTLVGGASLTAASFGDLGQDEGFGFSIGPRIDWPALDFRRNQLRTEAARAGAEAQFLRYDQAILSGVRDVETSLSTLDAGARSARRAAAAASSAREAAELSRLRYREGADPFFSVLDAERRQFDAEDRLAVARTIEALAYVRLNQALGVGWSDAPRTQVATAP